MPRPSWRIAEPCSAKWDIATKKLSTGCAPPSGHGWRDKMETGEYLPWFAVGVNESIAAGLGLWLMNWPPHMIGPGALRGNILNVYTEPHARRLGLARRLMETALAWCRSKGIRAVILHSSEDGRRLYESLGFKATNEMRLEIGS